MRVDEPVFLVSLDELKNAAAHTAALENCHLTPKTKPGKPGFLSTHKPGFTGLKIAGLPGFSGTRVSFPIKQTVRV